MYFINEMHKQTNKIMFNISTFRINNICCLKLELKNSVATVLSFSTLKRARVQVLSGMFHNHISPSQIKLLQLIYVGK